MMLLVPMPAAICGRSSPTLDDDELVTVWSDDTTLGWISEVLVLTDGEASSRGSISCGSGLGELRECVLVEPAASHRVRLV